MNTKINLTYNNVNYTLEYNRMSIKAIESEGFELESFSKKPMSMIELAFKGAFLKNHRNINPNLVEEIYSKSKNKEKLIEVITTMITECYNSLVENPKEDEEGNATWEVVDLSPKESQK
jgi:hypothetical protein